MVASFCKSHLNPIWIGSNSRQSPTVVHSSRKVYHWANAGGSWRPDLFSGAMDGPRPSTDVLGGVWSRGLLCAYRDQYPMLAGTPTPFEDPNWPISLILSSTGERQWITVGRGPGFELVLKLHPIVALKPWQPSRLSDPRCRL